jgi:hypothetical protein
MKRTLIMVVALFLMQANVDVEGEWAATLTLPLGDTWFNMYLVQKGNQLSGYMINESGQFDVKGSISRDQIKIQWEYPDGGRVLTILFTGKVDRNTISGVAKVGDVGEGPMHAQRK